MASIRFLTRRNLQKLFKQYSSTSTISARRSENVEEDSSKRKTNESQSNSTKDVLHTPKIGTAKNIVTLSNLAESTLSDLLGTNGTSGIANWKRFPLLNDYLHGFRLGELTILTGPTGSGKTTFLSEYSLDLAEQKVNTLWCNFELKNSRLCAMMVRQFYSTLAKPLDPQSIDRNVMLEMMKKMCQELPLFFTTFMGATKVDDVLRAINEQCDIMDLHHVIIDNLQFMIGAAGSGAVNPFMIQDSVFAKFRKVATERNIHVTMVIHPRKFAHNDQDQELSVHSLYGGGKAAQEADNILLIQTRHNNQEFFSKYLQIAKNRYFGDTYLGDRLQMTFQKSSQRHTLTWKKNDFETYKPRSGPACYDRKQYTASTKN